MFYVEVSRAKFDAKLYTNDAEKLPAAIAMDNVKHAALDLNWDRRGM